MKQLLDWFGVSPNTPSQRGRTLLQVIGVAAGDHGTARSTSVHPTT